jgi:hypothetical protein
MGIGTALGVGCIGWRGIPKAFGSSMVDEGDVFSELLTYTTLLLNRKSSQVVELSDFA